MFFVIHIASYKLWPIVNSAVMTSSERRQRCFLHLQLFQQQHGTQYGVVFAASLIAVVPVIVVFIVFQRHFVKGITSAAVKG